MPTPFFSHLLIRAIIASPCRASAATEVARLASGSPPDVQFLNCLLTRAGTSSFWTLEKEAKKRHGGRRGGRGFDGIVMLGSP